MRGHYIEHLWLNDRREPDAGPYEQTLGTAVIYKEILLLV